MVPWRMLKLSGAVCVGLISSACGDEAVPTGPSQPLPEEEATPPTTQTVPTGEIFNERAVGIAPGDYGMLSDSTDRAAGTYRLQRLSGSAPPLAVDDVIVGRGDDRFLRRVVDVSRVDDIVTLETVPAYWPDIILGGRYEISAPLVPSAPTDDRLVTNESAGPGSGFGGSVEWSVVNFDLCSEIDGLCNFFVEDGCKKFGTGTTVEVCGELTKLEVVEARVGFGGSLDGVLEIRGPSFDAGRAPIFFPCHQMPYAIGCIPLTETLDSFFRLIGLDPPDPLLPVPNSVCIPGTSIWPSWYANPLTCQITDYGRPPELQLGGLEEAGFVTSANIGGEVVLDIAGTGKVTVKIPMTGLAVDDSVGTDSALVKLKYSVGPFVVLKVEMSEAGATVRFGMEEGVRVTQGWSPTSGWQRDAAEMIAIVPHDFSGQIEPRAPDSVTMRAATQLEVTMGLCLTLFAGGCAEDEEETNAALVARAIASEEAASAGLFDIIVKAEAGATVARFVHGVYSRDEWMDSRGETFDNWHIDIDGAYDLVVKAGLELTLPFEDVFEPIAPGDLELVDTTLECCRMDLVDLYGTGRLEVETVTTGAAIDPDGYTILVYRADSTHPKLFAQDAQPIGAQSYRDTLVAAAPSNGTIAFEPNLLPCSILYTDIAMFSFPVATLVTSAARRLGVAVPNFAASLFCDLVIAEYEVTLTGVAENCSVSGAPRRVTLQQENLLEGRSNTVSEVFDVNCMAADGLGALSITTETRGDAQDLDVNGYNVLVDGALRGVVGVNDALQITGLNVGSREVKLTGVSGNCDASDPTKTTLNARQVDVESGLVTPVDVFVVTCGPPGTQFGDLRVLTATTGDDVDRDGYTLFVDGEERAAVDPNGESVTSGIQVGKQIVVYLDAIAENCAVDGSNPRIVQITVATDSLGQEILSTQTDYDVTCWPLATVFERHEGKVSLRGSDPVLRVMLDLPDDTSIRLFGGLERELRQLAGATIAVKGLVDDSGLDVVGYDIVSSEGSGRFFGFLVQRGVEGGQPPVFHPCNLYTTTTVTFDPMCQLRGDPDLSKFDGFYRQHGIPIPDGVPPPPDGVCVPGEAHQVEAEVKNCQVVDLGLPDTPEMWLVTGTEIQLVDVPEAMWDAAGSLVWIAGEVIEDRLRPEVFGVIRAAQ